MTAAIILSFSKIGLISTGVISCVDWTSFRSNRELDKSLSLNDRLSSGRAVKNSDCCFIDFPVSGVSLPSGEDNDICIIKSLPKLFFLE